MSVRDELIAHAVAPSLDKLENIRNHVRRRRALGVEIADLEERLADMTRERHELDTKVLPDLFVDAGVDRVGIPAEGNQPACDAKLRDHYKASIPLSWDAQRREEAFATLSKLGLDYLVRHTVELERLEQEHYERLLASLADSGVSFSAHDGVHWRSLTSALQALCEDGRTPTAADLEKIGAFVGRIVTLKERSDT
jgi:hypothetical protein